MSGSRWERLAAAGGAIFALLFVVGLVLQGIAGSGAADETRQEVAARYSDNGNELLALVGGLLLGLAIVFLLAFLGMLRAALRRVEGERAIFSTAAVAGGVLTAAMVFASSATTVAAFSSYDFYEAYQVDPDVVLLMQSLSFSFLGYALVAGAVLVGATSVVALKTRLFPRWFALAGFVLAAVCLLGEFALYIPIPVPLLALWVLVVSSVLVARERRPLASQREPAVSRRDQQ